LLEDNERRKLSCSFDRVMKLKEQCRPNNLGNAWVAGSHSTSKVSFDKIILTRSLNVDRIVYIEVSEPWSETWFGIIYRLVIYSNLRVMTIRKFD
jgi:hypothetical protein